MINQTSFRAKREFLSRKTFGALKELALPGAGAFAAYYGLSSNVPKSTTEEIDTAKNGINTDSEHSDIPKWIQEMFNKVDKKQDGILTQDEIDNLDREKEHFGTIYIIEDGMNINDFINKNRSVFNGYVHFEGDLVAGRQIIDSNGKLQMTSESRKISNDSEKSVEVMQGEYSIIKYSENTPFMHTYGILNCFALTIYDKETKTGFLAHIDTTEKAKSLNKILGRLKYQGFDTKSCEARIIGGQDYIEMETVKEIQKQLNAKNFSIVEMDLFRLNAGNIESNIQLDLNTGEVTNFEKKIFTRDDSACFNVRALSNNTLREYKPKI